MTDPIKQLQEAKRLALQAKAAAQAGNHKRAARLRSRMDVIYDDLETKVRDHKFSNDQLEAIWTAAS